MLTEKINIDICIATYKRVELLEKLLNSLAAQTLDANIKIRIIIIDNDPEKSAQNMVVNFFSNNATPYIYDTQPEKNISLTRNKALDYATADYLAFIDDDEWAEPDWLQQLLIASQQYNADVVFGPVISEIPDDAPAWVRTEGVFNRVRTKTGTIKKDGGAGNCLIRRTGIIYQLIQFDHGYGLSGGEDTELFSRLYANGTKLIWCDEAVAHEAIPYNRMTIQWVAKRALRCGQIFAHIHLKKASPLKKFVWLIKRLSYLFLLSLLLPTALFIGKSYKVRILSKLMANIGHISAIFSKKTYHEYK